MCSYPMWRAIVAARICSELCVRVGSSTGAGTARDPVLLACAGLSLVLKLDEDALVALVSMPKLRIFYKQHFGDMD